MLARLHLVGTQMCLILNSFLSDSGHSLYLDHPTSVYMLLLIACQFYLVEIPQSHLNVSCQSGSSALSQQKPKEFLENRKAVFARSFLLPSCVVWGWACDQHSHQILSFTFESHHAWTEDSKSIDFHGGVLLAWLSHSSSLSSFSGSCFCGYSSKYSVSDIFLY